MYIYDILEIISGSHSTLQNKPTRYSLPLFFSKTALFGPLKMNVGTKVGLIYLFTRRERGEEGGRIPLGLVKREEEEEALFPRLALP